MRLIQRAILLALVVSFVCNISAADSSFGNNERKTDQVFNVDGRGRRNLKGIDNVKEEVAKTSQQEERAILSALTNLKNGFRHTDDLAQIKNAFQNEPPLTSIRVDDLTTMKAALSKSPSLEKSLDKVSLTAAKKNANRIGGFEHFIENVSLTKLLYVLTITGVLATGGVILKGLAKFH
ncbi:RxLR effector protein [Phytophthora megakarya]|uniref:RxLR effector protein n=1 Tax=Phytophthora megakarya TaxID=4795 RepID=A0A225V9H6_9STRA|nr:RxLR effector protein [Phytophthora megakarya]